MARKRTAFRVEWAQTARADLEAIVDYIADDSVQNALSILDKLEQTAASLATVPKRGRVVPELAAVGVHGYRELLPSPWRIIYRISENTVYVLAVFDGRRNLGDLLLERFLR